MNTKTLSPTMKIALAYIIETSDARKGAGVVAGLNSRLRESTALALETRGLITIQRETSTYRRNRGVGRNIYSQTCIGVEYICRPTVTGRESI